MEGSIKKFGFDNDNAKTIVFSFAGQGSAGVVGYEWVNFFKDRPVKVVCVRDHHKAYYMGNLYSDEGNPISTGVDSHTKLFQSIVDESNCENIIMTGSSLGGYACALYGVLLNANFVLPYSSQTFIRTHPKYGENDRRHLKTYAYRASSSNDQEKYFDLTDLDFTNFTGEMHFHWSTSWRDERYVNHMKEFAENYPKNKNNGNADDIIDIKVHDITWKHAKLCKKLKDAGELSLHFEKIII
tara:strand:- start:2224 stop:2946 length:723 start_codon:yes stop_codon:yes gene_type:complete